MHPVQPRSLTITQRYNIYFAGELLEGFTREAVQENLLRLFNTDRRTVDALFSGQARLLKKHCDKATALKYQQAMRRCGAKPVIRPVQEDSPAATEPAARSDSTSTSSPTASASLCRKIYPSTSRSNY